MSAELAPWLLTWMLRQPPPAGEEHLDTRPRRLAVAAVAIDDAVRAEPWDRSPRDKAATALATAWEESQRFLYAVHAGMKRGDRGASNCFMQINLGNPIPSPEWATLHGVDLAASRRCALAGVETLEHLDRICRRKVRRENWAPAMFTHYATGRRCSPFWSGSWRRYRLTVSILRSRKISATAVALVNELTGPHPTENHQPGGAAPP